MTDETTPKTVSVTVWITGNTVFQIVWMSGSAVETVSTIEAIAGMAASRIDPARLMTSPTIWVISGTAACMRSLIDCQTGRKASSAGCNTSVIEDPVPLNASESVCITTEAVSIAGCRYSENVPDRLDAASMIESSICTSGFSSPSDDLRASIAVVPMVPIASERTGPIPESIDGSSPIRVPTISPTLGTTFEAATTAESTSWPVRADMSAVSLPSPTSQLSQAAFMAETEPSIVVEASRAVVPPICIDSCMTWMAATMLSKLMDEESTVTPSFCWTSVILEAS